AVERLIEIDDVDAVALTENEPLHLRVPAPGLMTEMDSGLEQLPHGDDSHVNSFPSVVEEPDARADREVSDRGCTGMNTGPACSGRNPMVAQQVRLSGPASALADRFGSMQRTGTMGRRGRSPGLPGS